MKQIISLLALLLVLTLSGAALADSLVLDGTVTNDVTVQVYAPIGGTVDQVLATAGESVTEGQAIASLRTNKVYATENGTITGIFGQAGDSADTISSRYGAVMYLEGDSIFTVSASTTNAYNSTETKFVHVGESVYLQGRTSSSRVGTGLITGVDGTNYTVEVTSGNFIIGDSVDVFRDSAYSTQQRIGRGTVGRRNPIAVTGSGSIVRYNVKSGDTVKRGNLLFETLDGSFDGLYMTGTEIPATVTGTLAEIKLSAGSAAQKGAVAAVIYPTASMRVTAEIPEEDLSNVNIGDKVNIELTADEDEGTVYTGTISMISRIATQSQGNSDSVTFTVYIDFDADEHVRYGMSALISTPEEEDEPVYAEDEDDEEPEVDEEEAETQARDGFSDFPQDGERSRPDGAQGREGFGNRTRGDDSNASSNQDQ